MVVPIVVLALDACKPEVPPADRTSLDTADCDPAVPSVLLPELGGAFSGSHETIDPAALDPATRIDAGLHHLLLPPEDVGDLRPELFVLLPGTNGQPSNSTELLTIAARLGYRALGLAYPSADDVEALCAGSSAPEECSVAFYEEKLYGRDAGVELSVPEADSVVGRLRRFLEAAPDAHPEAGFDGYLEGGTVRWDRVVLAGFSQGSSLAAWLGRDELLARSVHLAGGCNPVLDEVGLPTPAQWCAEPRATDGERMFALVHTRDQPEFYAEVWREVYDLDRFGDPPDASTSSPSYCTDAHLLETPLEPRDGGTPHQSLAVDAFLPSSGEILALAEDYAYLFGGALEAQAGPATPRRPETSP